MNERESKFQHAETEASPTEAEMSRSLREFLEALKGWRTSPDGEDFCPDHWGMYLGQFKAEERKMIKEDSLPTKKLSRYHKMLDGWGTVCQYDEKKDGKLCGKTVFVPYRAK